ncbi:glucose/galactose transporter [Chitinophaga jiangningensis]|uniref:Glucose/galactose transporter n=1 Tax=Chitinophaga jiangningensis TaxID=1419482 RepID=A0A1M6VDJ3_9BACT|nr:sugar MFS transporter [Chitinophaga jiangningensis]SHK79552.1 glucose/galactose transporter [Chitinophaga jiangningensis]
MSNQTVTMEVPAKKVGYGQAMAIISMLFFVFGFVTWLNGALIQFFEIVCELNVSQSLLVTFAFYLAYLFLSIPSSYILEKTGFKNGMSIGLGIIALGSLVFIPAANARSYPMFLTGLFIQGGGLSLLQTAVNPYASIIGPKESAAKRISIMGICNKVAGALAPIILGVILLSGAEELKGKIAAATDPVVKAGLLDNLASRVIGPYTVIAIVLLILAVLLKKSSLPEIDTNEEDAATAAATVGKTSIFQFPHLLLGVLCIFVYVGVEVMAGDVIGSYGKSMGMSLDQTKYFTSFTLVAMLAGYIIGIITIPKYLSAQKSLLICAALGIVFTVLAYTKTGFSAVTCIALLGLANSLMWPAIFPMAIDGLGKFTKTGSALLVMGIVGGAVLPQVYSGMFNKESMFSFLYSPNIDFRHAFLYCMLPCYLYILFYAVAGHKIGKKQLVTA